MRLPRPPSAGATRTSAPKWRSMRSVWSRVGLGLDHGGLARGVEAGQQDGGLHLRRGDRQAVFDRQHLVGADDGERQAAALARLEARAHARQRLDHPLHRPAAQRGVAGHEAGEADGWRGCPRAGGPRCRSCRGRARRPARGRRRRRSRARATAPVAARARPRAPSARSAAAVRSTSSPSSRPRDRGLAERQGAEHQGAVRDRLVARRAHPALQAVDRTGDKLGRMGSQTTGQPPAKAAKMRRARPSYHAGIWF